MQRQVLFPLHEEMELNSALHSWNKRLIDSELRRIDGVLVVYCEIEGEDGDS